MRPTAFAAAALGSVVALVGFAGAAQASATIDLIWIDVTNVDSGGNPICLIPAERNCPQLGTTISSLAVADDITLGVIITAGPNSSLGVGVSVNYGNALPILSVTDFGSLTTEPFLPVQLGPTTNQPPFIDFINAVAVIFQGLGIGLPAGQSAYIGTVSFHKDLPVNGLFEISVGTDGPGGADAVLDLAGNNISSTTTFNSAFLTDVLPTPTPTPTPTATPTATPTPICDLVIEINTLRAGGKTVRAGPNQTVNVTAKARILKGTAVPGTLIDTTLAIQAVDGTDVIGTNSAGPIQLEIGKGGKGAKLPLDIPQCTTGFIDFVAEFSGVHANGSLCEETRTLRRECR